MSAPLRLTTPRDNLMAIEADHVREARCVLEDEFERGYAVGRLTGRVEAVVVMAAAALSAVAVWSMVR